MNKLLPSVIAVIFALSFLAIPVFATLPPPQQSNVQYTVTDQNGYALNGATVFTRWIGGSTQCRTNSFGICLVYTPASTNIFYYATYNGVNSNIAYATTLSNGTLKESIIIRPPVH